MSDLNNLFKDLDNISESSSNDIPGAEIDIMEEETPDNRTLDEKRQEILGKIGRYLGLPEVDMEAEKLKREQFMDTHFVRSFKRVGNSHIGHMLEMIVVDNCGKEEVVRGIMNDIGNYIVKNTIGYLYSEDHLLRYDTKFVKTFDRATGEQGIVIYVYEHKNKSK